MMEENRKLNKEEDSIDIIALLKSFWISRRTIIIITLVFVSLGFFVAIFSKKKYVASSTFVPLSQGKSSVGNLGGLASLAGINLGSSVNSNEISPELYPEIINSYPYQRELLNTSLNIIGEKKPVTYEKYYKDIYSIGVLGYFKKYTIGLPSVIISSFRSNTEKIEQKENINLTTIDEISKEEYSLIKQLSSQIKLEVNKKEGYITISATMDQPVASAQLALKAQETLQEYALFFKTQKSKQELDFIKARFKEKEKEFNTVKYNLARFQDRNNSINTAMGRTRLLQLQSDYDLAFTVYSELAKQYETQLLQVKKDTPLFTVLKPVTIPTEKTEPSRILILLAYSVFGLILSLGFVAVKIFYLKFKEKW